MRVPATRLDPRKLSPADAALLLTKVGGKAVTEATIAADMSAGAPTNSDGTLNLVTYAAWLVRKLAEGDPHGD